MKLLTISPPRPVSYFTYPPLPILPPPHENTPVLNSPIPVPRCSLSPIHAPNQIISLLSPILLFYTLSFSSFAELVSLPSLSNFLSPYSNFTVSSLLLLLPIQTSHYLHLSLSLLSSSSISPFKSFSFFSIFMSPYSNFTVSLLFSPPSTPPHSNVTLPPPVSLTSLFLLSLPIQKFHYLRLSPISLILSSFAKLHSSVPGRLAIWVIVPLSISTQGEESKQHKSLRVKTKVMCKFWQRHNLQTRQKPEPS